MTTCFRWLSRLSGQSSRGTGQGEEKLHETAPNRCASARLVPVTVLLWVTIVVGGMALLWRHALTPGAVAHPQPTWPLEGILQRTDGIDTLVMTVHPQCPCSRASVHQLEILTAHCSGKLRTYVLMAQPVELDEPAHLTPLWKTITQIPGVVAVIDKDGAMAKRLGAQTSGQVFLYGGNGQLKFSGGITSARGHDGDSDGMTAITAIVHGQTPAVQSTPVYGCSIR